MFCFPSSKPKKNIYIIVNNQSYSRSLCIMTIWWNLHDFWRWFLDSFRLFHKKSKNIENNILFGFIFWLCGFRNTLFPVTSSYISYRCYRFLSSRRLSFYQIVHTQLVQGLFGVAIDPYDFDIVSKTQS